ncbi:V-type ATP synthase subunit C [Lachnospiraceae bacterium KM106-2]|nr:V-type ATP synthase subunit C [Lachnospiraceae bacterium KM106-2]
MPGNLLTYSGIITKAKALESNLMTLDDYRKIAYFDNILDFINFLKTKRSYLEIFQEHDEQTLHRSEIEMLIKNSLFLSFAKLFRFANIEQRSVLTFIFFRMEVNIVKDCLQNVFNEEDRCDLSLFESFFLKHSNLKVTALASSKNIDDFIHNLSNTEYHAQFKKWQNSSFNSLHDYEIQLDVYYFSKVWRLKDRLLKGADKKAFTDILGHEIDLLNIEWIYRSRMIYDIDPSKILSTLIPITYKLNSLQLKRLAEAVSQDEFLRTLHATYYHNAFKDNDFSNIESDCTNYISKIYKLNTAKYNASMAPILQFIHVKEVELDRLTTALECIRYKLDPSEAIKYILK